MEQHPIPQNISSYQFRLVGDMTLKQFFQLAGGLLIAFIVYSLPIIKIITVPFAIIFAILGAALAFFPIAERPLEKWIFAFFKAIYSPTEFIWKKTNTHPKFFQDEPADAIASLSDKLTSTPQNKLEVGEQGFVSKISGLFAIPKKPVTTAVPTTVTPPVTPRVVVPVVPTVLGNEMISTKQAVYSVDAAPPTPPTSPNVVVGQVVDQDRRIIEGAIMEIRDATGRPIRALRSNKLGHFITVTTLDNGKYSIVTEKDGYEFTTVSFEASGGNIPPILIQGKRTAPINYDAPAPNGKPVQTYVPGESPNFQ